MAMRHQNRGKSTKSGVQHKIAPYMTSDDQPLHLDSDSQSTSETPGMAAKDRMADDSWKATLKYELEKHTTCICSKIDEINRQIKEISDRVDQVEKAVDFNTDKLTEMAGNEDRIGAEIENLKTKILLAEIYSRKSNLLIMGVPDKETNLLDACKQRFIDILDLDSRHVSDMRFVNIHRLPRMDNTYAIKRKLPTPIIIKFVEMADRQSILEAAQDVEIRKKMAEHSFTVQTDLPPELKRTRGLLLKKRYLLKKKHPSFQTKVWQQGASILMSYRKDKNSPWCSLGVNDDLP